MYLDHGAVQRDRLDFESQDLFPLQIFEDPLQNSALGPTVHTGVRRVKRYIAQRSFNIEQKKRTTPAGKKQTAESGPNNTESKKLKTPKTRKVPALKRTPLTPDERKERQRIQFKAKLERAKSLGLCRHCGEPAIQDQTRCETCAEKHRVSYKNKHRERYDAAKLANGDPSNKPKVPDHLGNNLPQPVKQTTLHQAKPLSEKTNSESRREYERLRRQRPERREARRKAAEVSRQKAQDLGLCRVCRNPALLGQTRCEICAEKHRQGNRRGAAVRREKQKPNKI